MYMYCTVYICLPMDGWISCERQRIERKIMLTTIENRQQQQQQQRCQDCIQGKEGNQDEIDPQLWLQALVEAAPNTSHRRYSSWANIISATSSMGSPSTPSSSSSVAASQIEAQSTKSFFLDKSMTLGSLIGIELKPRLVNVEEEEEEEEKKKKKKKKTHASTFACDPPSQVERTEKESIQQSCPIILLGCGALGGGWKFLWKLVSRNHVTGTMSSFDCIYVEDKKETTNFEERWECDTKRVYNLKTLMMINESNATSTATQEEEEEDNNLTPSPLGLCSSPQGVGWNVFNGNPLLLPWDR